MGKSENRVFYFERSDSLADGAELDSREMDFSDVAKYQINFIGDVEGLTFTSYSRSFKEEDLFSNGFTFTASRFFLANFPVRQRYMGFKLTNNTGQAVTNVSFEVKVFYSAGDNMSVFPISIPPRSFSPAALTQSVLIGQSPDGEFKNTGVNEAGALLFSEFGTEVARGLYDGYSINTKFGRNPEINTNTTPEDIYNGGGEYTGFNATSNQNISATSASASDTGSLISSGTFTGVISHVVTDSSATFVSDGVTIGDLLINDTQGIHGIITSIDSETQITVFQMLDGVSEDIFNIVGDTYRIARATGTGAGVLKLKNIIDEGFNEVEDVYIILNGLTTVTTTGINAIRAPSGRIIIAGSANKNVGEITVTQSITTANVFCVIPILGSTTIGAFTVPKSKDCVIKRILCSVTRDNGLAGSATISINVWPFGQSFTSERVYELQTGAAIEDNIIGGIVLPPATDVKATVETVSDNGTVAQINIEYYLIDR